jgi:hypothetical protein
MLFKEIIPVYETHKYKLLLIAKVAGTYCGYHSFLKG